MPEGCRARFWLTPVTAASRSWPQRPVQRLRDARKVSGANIIQSGRSRAAFWYKKQVSRVVRAIVRAIHAEGDEREHGMGDVLGYARVPESLVAGAQILRQTCHHAPHGSNAVGYGIEHDQGSKPGVGDAATEDRRRGECLTSHLTRQLLKQQERNSILEAKVYGLRQTRPGF